MKKLEINYKANLEINVEIYKDDISDEMIEKMRNELTDAIRGLLEEEIVNSQQGQVVVTEQLNEVTYKENDNEGI